MVDQAAVILETKRVNETVHAALRQVIDARRRLRLLDLDPDLTFEGLESERLGRFPPEPDPDRDPCDRAR